MESASLAIRSGRGIPRSMLWWAACVAGAALLVALAAVWTSFDQAVRERGARAVLSARMVERGVTRTLESVEMALLAIAEETRSGLQSGHGLERTRQRVTEVLRFAPHIRQIVVVQDGAVLADSNGGEGGRLDMRRLNLSSDLGGMSLGLRIGDAVHSRFLPLEGAIEAGGEGRSLIPVGLTVSGRGAGEVVLVAALNSLYLRTVFEDAVSGDHGGYVLGRLDGRPLTAGGRADWAAAIPALTARGADESFRQSSNWGWPEETVAARLSARYPVGIVLGYAHGDTLADWLEGNRVMLAVLAGTTLAVAAAIALLLRDAIRRAGLQNQVRLLFQAVEQSPVVVVVTDAAGNVEYVNPSFQRLFGYAPDEVLGRNPRLLGSGLTSAEIFADLWRTIEAGRSWTGDFVNRAKNGTLLTISSTISAVRDERGATTHYVGVMADVTDAKRAEEEREALLLKLSRAHADLQRFAEVSAHHLQEPARRLVTFAQRLKAVLPMDTGDDEAAVSLRFIEQQAARLRNLIRDIQLYLSADQPLAPVECTDAGRVVAAVLQKKAKMIVEAGTDIVVDALPPAQIDAPRLAEMFEILIGNAIEYCRPGVAPHIRVEGERLGAIARYRVTDNGIGIPAGHRERVFQVFERLHAPSGDSRTGIGLAVVRRIVESRGGRVWIEQPEGQGTVVVAELEAGQDDADKG